MQFDKMRQRTIWLVLFWVVIASGGLAVAQNDGATVTDRLRAKASEIVGVERLPHGTTLSEQAAVEMIVGSDSTSPFVAERINGQHVWRVRYGKVLLQFEKWADTPVKPREYDLEVYFDSASGRLLKISLLNEQQDTALVKKPTARCAEIQLQGTPRFQPNDDPTTSFVEVLASLPRCPLLATEIVAFYWLMDLHGEGQAQPIWEVYLYGNPSFRFKPAPIKQSLSDRSYVRYLVNASSAKWIMSSNDPSPTSPKCK